MARPAVSKTHGKDYEDFGRKIAEAREEKKLSQKEASQLLGIPQSTYAGYETGTRKIPLSLIKELSKFYGVSADQLLGNDEAEPGNPIDTIAAHFKGKSISDEKLKRIEKFIEFTLNDEE